MSPQLQTKCMQVLCPGRGEENMTHLREQSEPSSPHQPTPRMGLPSTHPTLCMLSLNKLPPTHVQEHPFLPSTMQPLDLLEAIIRWSQQIVALPLTPTLRLTEPCACMTTHPYIVNSVSMRHELPYARVPPLSSSYLHAMCHSAVCHVQQLRS